MELLLEEFGCGRRERMRSKRRAFAWGQTFHLHLLRKNRGPVGVTYFSCFSEIPRNSLTKKTFTITEANKIARVAASNVHKVWINSPLPSKGPILFGLFSVNVGVIALC
jgi:hypothetical protein